MLFALPLFAGGCALLSAVLGGQRPTLTFREARLTSWALDRVDLDLVFELDNPFDLDITLQQVAYQLEVEGRRLASGAPKEGLRVRGRGKQLLRFPATVHFLDVVPAVTALFSKNELAYRASGSIGVATPVGVVSLPLSHQGAISVPRLPRVEITGLSAPKLSATGAELSLGVKLHNPNDFPVKLDGLDWSFLVDRASLATGKVGATSLAKGGEREIRIPIRIGMGEGLQAIQRLASGQTRKVSLSGNLRAGRIAAPVDAARTLALDRT